MIKDEEATSDKVYDACAASYGYDIQSTLAARLKYEIVRNVMQSHFEVLDVGCGNGKHMRALATSCSRIAGIDINERMLGYAMGVLRKDGIANVTLSQQSATALQFKDSCFDLVYSFSTLLLVPDTRRAIAEMVRVLKTDGIAVLDIAGWYNLSRLYWSFYYRRHGHFGVNSFSFKEISALLRRLGMELVEQHALGFTDQWKYIPGVHKLKFLEMVFHDQGPADLDYRISNSRLLFPFANRWYIVCRKAPQSG